ncbi:unnamed protein product, partial [Amoebophrya sp. A120]
HKIEHQAGGRSRSPSPERTTGAPAGQGPYHLERLEVTKTGTTSIIASEVPFAAHADTPGGSPVQPSKSKSSTTTPGRAAHYVVRVFASKLQDQASPWSASELKKAVLGGSTASSVFGPSTHADVTVVQDNLFPVVVYRVRRGGISSAAPASGATSPRPEEVFTEVRVKDTRDLYPAFVLWYERKLYSERKTVRFEGNEEDEEQTVGDLAGGAGQGATPVSSQPGGPPLSPLSGQGEEQQALPRRTAGDVHRHLAPPAERGTTAQAQAGGGRGAGTGAVQARERGSAGSGRRGGASFGGRSESDDDPFAIDEEEEEQEFWEHQPDPRSDAGYWGHNNRPLQRDSLRRPSYLRPAEDARRGEQGTASQSQRGPQHGRDAATGGPYNSRSRPASSHDPRSPYSTAGQYNSQGSSRPDASAGPGTVTGAFHRRSSGLTTADEPGRQEQRGNSALHPSRHYPPQPLPPVNYGNEELGGRPVQR